MSADTRLPIALVAQHAYCPRCAWLEAHGDTVDVAQIAEGKEAHVAVDDPSTRRTKRLTSVGLQSERLGVTGRCDVVEVGDGGAVTVVEHKATPVRRKLPVSLRTQVQLALQAMCLEEMGYEVAGAEVWNATLRRRVEVRLDNDLRDLALEHLEACRAVVMSPEPPPPLEDDPRCYRCSHVSICLPDEHLGRSPARRISATDPAGHVLHLTTPGAKARFRAGRIEVFTPEADDPQRVPIEQVIGVVAHGNADLSSAVIREVLTRGFPIVWCTWNGRVVGWATPAEGPNGDVRRYQYSVDDERRTEVARRIVSAKITNQAAFLRRHAAPERENLLSLAEAAKTAPSVDTVLGIEGRAAVVYFQGLSSAIRQPWARFERRSGRPAGDAGNACLNLLYALLLSDALRAVAACGLDPAGGVLHSPVRNKPALALDLMEEFRPVIADSAFVWAVNNGELRESDFRSDLGTPRLTDRGRKALISAYERRVTTEFRHPRFGYRVSWRRAMEIQARLMLAFFRGELSTYHPILLR